MPHVLVVSTSFPMLTNPASGVFVKRQLEALPPEWEITVLTPATFADTQPRQEGRLQIIPVGYAPRQWMRLAHEEGGVMPQIRQAPIKAVWLMTLIPAMLIAIFRHAKSNQVIYANWAINGVLCGIVGKLMGRPVVTAFRGSDLHDLKNSRFKRLLVSACIKLSQQITTVSPSLLATLDIIPAARSRPCQVIENGVDTSFLAIPEATIERPLRLLAIGALTPNKDYATLLCAMAHLDNPNIELTIAGNGPEYARLSELAAQLDMSHRVHLLGNVSPEAIRDLLAHHPVFVHTSRAEGRSNAILEAMAAARLILCSDIPANRELIENSRGILFPCGDVFALATLLLNLLNTSSWGLHAHLARQFILDNDLTWAATGVKLAHTLSL